MRRTVLFGFQSAAQDVDIGLCWQWMPATGEAHIGNQLEAEGFARLPLEGLAWVAAGQLLKPHASALQQAGGGRKSAIARLR